MDTLGVKDKDIDPWTIYRSMDNILGATELSYIHTYNDDYEFKPLLNTLGILTVNKHYLQ